jgi:hypothetical protein
VERGAYREARGGPTARAARRDARAA